MEVGKVFLTVKFFPLDLLIDVPSASNIGTRADLRDRKGDQRGGVNGSRLKFIAN